jgi:hypothetical protein
MIWMDIGAEQTVRIWREVEAMQGMIEAQDIGEARVMRPAHL